MLDSLGGNFLAVNVALLLLGVPLLILPLYLEKYLKSSPHKIAVPVLETELPMSQPLSPGDQDRIDVSPIIRPVAHAAMTDVNVGVVRRRHTSSVGSASDDYNPLSASIDVEV